MRMIATLLAAAMLPLTASASADAMPAQFVAAVDEPPEFFGRSASSGTRVTGLSRSGVQALGRSYYKSATSPKPPFHDYTATSLCGSNPGDTNADVFCGRAVAYCANNPPDARGPAVVIYRREVTRAGQPVPGPNGRWAPVATTCFPDAVPGAGNVLTMAMVRAAFRDTDFTAPTMNIQPEGDLTLVNLPTYFQTRFPDRGFGPDEVDTTTILGHRVQIRPQLDSVTYRLGATTIGPTTSLGGPYPEGDIIATYRRAGTMPTRADITYTGQFRIAGGAWIDIPDQVTVPGSPVPLTVKEARSRLVAPPGG